MSDRAPEATELVYVPEPSWMPAIAAFGLVGVLAGLFVWWPYGVIGAAIALVGFARMMKQASDNVDRLPRRQKLTTAVLPPVPRRRD